MPQAGGAPARARRRLGPDVEAAVAVWNLLRDLLLATCRYLLLATMALPPPQGSYWESLLLFATQAGSHGPAYLNLIMIMMSAARAAAAAGQPKQLQLQ